MDSEPDWACDLEDCPNEARGTDDEDDGHFPPMPPEGWVSVLVKRHDAHDVVLAFCSEAHLADGMQAPLPPPRPHGVSTR